MEHDMSDQIAPSVLFEVKARRPLALVRRQHFPTTVEIDGCIVKLHRPDMDCVVKCRKFGRRYRPSGHNKNFTAEEAEFGFGNVPRKAWPAQRRRSAKTLSDGQGPSSRAEGEGSGKDFSLRSK